MFAEQKRTKQSFTRHPAKRISPGRNDNKTGFSFGVFAFACASAGAITSGSSGWFVKTLKRYAIKEANTIKTPERIITVLSVLGNDTFLLWTSALL